jgi:GDP-D-mannose dehydratase
MAMTRAFITGATGQDGTYLTRHLHAQGTRSTDLSVRATSPRWTRS